MFKKLTLLAMSVGALLAFAAPAAQATGPLITNSGAVAAKTITGTSTNTTTATAAGTLECTTVKLHANITTNASTTAKGTGSGTAEGTRKAIPPLHTGHCASSSGAVVEITNIIISDLHLTKHGAETTGTASLSYTYDLRSATGAGLIEECTFGGTVPVKRIGANILHVEGKIVKVPPSGAFCPVEGTLHGDFTILDEGGKAVFIH